MPIYEYRCQECKTLFECIITSSSQALPEMTCPGCGSANLKKIISASSFRISSDADTIPAGAFSGCSSRSGFS